jgi:hypothetical protein
MSKDSVDLKVKVVLGIEQQILRVLTEVLGSDQEIRGVPPGCEELQPDLGDISHSIGTEGERCLMIRVVCLQVSARFPKHPLEVSVERVLHLNEVIQLWLGHELRFEFPALVSASQRIAHERRGWS